MSIMAFAFAALLLIPWMLGLSIGAPPSRWGWKGPIAVAIGWISLFAVILLPELNAASEPPSPVMMTVIGLVFCGYPLGGAAWLLRWRSRQTDPRDYLQHAVQAALGSIGGALIGTVSGVLVMVIAIALFGAKV